MLQPLRVDPLDLRVTADKIDGHAADFANAHHTTLDGASQANLGTGLASAALPQLVAAWEADGTHFGEHFIKHADGHRAAAGAYLHTDTEGAERISDDSAAL